MLLNTDIAQRVVIATEEMPWVDSPLPGVRRRMLERDGEEVARATSIVRYAPGSRFAEHSHGLGEEFLVLEGVFSDEHGDYPAGTYVRNPPGSRHRPRSDRGCTLFVKLRQMDPGDRRSVRVDTLGSPWSPAGERGLLVMPLHSAAKETVSLMKLDPGTRLERHDHPAGEEIWVLEGVLEDDHGSYPKGTWLRNPPGSSHAPRAPAGCRFYVKTGHLAAG
ncbi:MAG: cupin domain-containing protein [Deltaproteobacteria bacterium]|nr:cupin domain-containing protein [Deltaproteobacteria bacterium]